ncbi:histone deacetylase family protein [Croceimicrobium hydrocarbonivorans]|uniref:Histone deacetylase n=1 Tax=Croceimicrobium hydrocarbonivorans TaxID=2761580 RepID=A0A7H0VH04_9FLAO|nr:histone deacetylase [Croceimicrobium hydrocarbonivorans]QNR25002.1 histone deacetylase [Croceimicrobium hydrocarbonivorans]
MLKIAFDPIYHHPLPEGHRFPMAKYSLLPEQLLYEGTCTEDNFFRPELLKEEQILRTHCPEYWQKLKDLKLSRAEERRTGFPLSAQLVERERRIAQGTIDCCFHALEYGVSLNIAGGTHHAYTNRGEGFCLLNDIGVAAHYLLDHNLAQQILVVDLDVHQGNGTAEIMAGENRVFTFSMHGEKNYPLHKEKSDLDIALADDTNDLEYLSRLREELPRLLDRLNADFIFYQSGVDVLATDKLGRLGMSIAGCKERDRFVFEEAQKRQIPVVCSMGGGYSERLADIVEAHANTYRLAQTMYF